MLKKEPKKTTVYLPRDLYDRMKESGMNFSAFVQDMLERELAGEFNQLKIDEAEKKLELLKSQNVHIQTKQQKQKKRSDDTYNRIIEDQLREREALRKQRRKKSSNGFK